MQIDDLLRIAMDRKSSDLHLKVGNFPHIRVDGELVPLNDQPRVTAEDMLSMAFSMMSNRQKQKFKENAELDMAYGVAGLGRFRVNVFQQRGTVGAVLRVIPFKVMTIRDLMLPPVLEKIALDERGLVLVTGTTGSGKSTTLAAMIDHINANETNHIMTIEDPIEFLHRHKKCMVNQREVGADTKSFNRALKSVLRQDPDIILVGEMRDTETMATALTAAETGHLVFATLHTQDAPQTIDRIIDVFPPYQQDQIRVQLSTTLMGVCTQQLLQTRDGRSRIVACELLIPTPAVRNLIREGKTHQIYSVMQTGTVHGMLTMDAALADLVRRGLISRELAERRSSTPEDLRRLLGTVSAV